MNKENNTVESRIRECRKEMGYSQETLAAMLYMKKTTICKYEKGERDITGAMIVTKYGDSTKERRLDMICKYYPYI